MLFIIPTKLVMSSILYLAVLAFYQVVNWPLLYCIVSSD